MEYKNIKEIGDFKQFIVRREPDQKHFAFKNVQEYLSMFKTCNTPSFHEYIYAANPRKFFLDIDDIEGNFGTKTKESDKAFETKLNLIKKIIARVIMQTFDNSPIFIENIATVDSSGYSRLKDKYVYSANLILTDYLVADAGTHAYLTNLVISEYEKETGKNDLIDTKQASNSSYYNRIIGCTKTAYNRDHKIISDNRFKKWNYKLFKIEELIISNFNTPLPTLYLEVPNKHEDNVISTDYPEILDSSKEFWSNNFRFKYQFANVVWFDRLKSSYCSICNRNHDSDNTMYALLYDDLILFKCKRDKSTILHLVRLNNNDELNGKTDELNGKTDELNRKTDTNKGETDELNRKTDTNKGETDEVNRKTDVIFRNRNKKELTYSTIALDKERVEWHEEIKDQRLIGSLALSDKKIDIIKACMKMGKTKFVIDHIEKEKYEKILIVSFRRTSTIENQSKYKDFVSYQNIKEHTISMDKYNKVIIQLESLSRLDLTTIPNLLVLDEMESIITQFSSGNFIDLCLSINIFKMLILHSDKVIMMDANISNRTLNVIEKLHPTRELLKDTHLYINSYNPSVNVEYLFLQDVGSFLHCLYDQINQDKNVMIMTNSIKESKRLREYLLEYLSSEEIMMYNSETLESVKKRHFSRVDEYWKKYRVIICTPTITAGVSFEAEHFHVVMGYFNNKSCNVATCHQMLGRVRNISDNKVYILIKEFGNVKFETDVKIIKDNLEYRRTELVKELPEYGIGNLDFDIDEMHIGRLKYNETLNYWLIIYNIAYDNESRNDFLGLFKEMLKVNKHKLIELKIDRELAEIQLSKYNKKKAEITTRTVSEVNNAPIITKEEYELINEKRKKSEDVTCEELISRDKFKMLSVLDISNLDIIPANYIKAFYQNKIELERLKRTREILELVAKHNSWELGLTELRNSELKQIKQYRDSQNIHKITNYESGYVIHQKVKELLRMTNWFGERFTAEDDLRKLFTSKMQFNRFEGNASEFFKQATEFLGMLDHRKRNRELTPNVLMANILRIIYMLDMNKSSIIPSNLIVYKYNKDYYSSGKLIKTEKKNKMVINLTN